MSFAVEARRQLPPWSHYPHFSRRTHLPCAPPGARDFPPYGMHMYKYAQALQAIAMSGCAAQILIQARPQPGKATIGSLLLRTGSEAMPLRAADNKSPRW